MLALPQMAQARGRKRAVPNLRESRVDRPSVRATAVRVPVVIHMATIEGIDAVAGARVARWVKRANEAFAPHGIEVFVQDIKRLPTGYTDVRRSRQRRELAVHAPHDGAVHLFVIESLDTAKPFRARRRVRGLHWRYLGIKRDLRRREYVVVTREAPDTTLAHELGHLMGLGHATREDNIMCSCRKGTTGFTWDQGASMRAGAGSFVTRQRQARRAARRWADRRRR